MADADTQTISRLYRCFNARDIDGVLVMLSDDVAWANGMDGAHVQGHEALCAYWTRQWSMVSPHVDPVTFSEATDGTVSVEVIQTVRDLHGQPLQSQTHGLKDKTTRHVFRLKDGKVTRFDVEDAA